MISNKDIIIRLYNNYTKRFVGKIFIAIAVEMIAVMINVRNCPVEPGR